MTSPRQGRDVERQGRSGLSSASCPPAATWSEAVDDEAPALSTGRRSRHRGRPRLGPSRAASWTPNAPARSSTRPSGAEDRHLHRGSRSPTSSRRSPTSTNGTPPRRRISTPRSRECIAALGCPGIRRPRLPADDPVLLVRSWAVPPFRVYYQRHVDELLIVRVYHQTRRPIAR